MTRQAILIEASRIKNHDDLPGAGADVAKFKIFLESAIGGAWKDSEIAILSHLRRISYFDTSSSRVWATTHLSRTRGMVTMPRVRRLMRRDSTLTMMKKLPYMS